MRSLARWGALPLLVAPLGSWALSLDEIELGSYLNQPLYAEIPLSGTPEELAALSVSMAPTAEFARRGIDPPGNLSSFAFNIVRNAAGQNVIRITSNRSMTEPFVTLVVEARLPGRVQFREYTVLLDPPLFLPEASAVEPVAPPAARVSAESGSGAIERPSSTAPITRPAPDAVSEPAPVTASSTPAPIPPVGDDGGDYTVRGGDTLWAIAGRNRPVGTTMNQTMMSIFQANPGAFAGNINRLRRGAILRIPPAAELSTMSATEATAEVARQTAAWSSGSEPSPVLVLLPPSEETGDEVGAGAAASEAAQAELAAAEADLAAAEAELEAALASRNEPGNLAQESDQESRLLELESPELANLQNQLEESAASEAAPLGDEAAATAAADAASEVVEPDQVFVDESEPAEEVAAETAPVAAAQARSEPAEPSWIDRVLGFLSSPFVLIGAGVLAVLAAAFAFLRRRQDSLEDVTGQWEALESEVEEEFDRPIPAPARAPAEPDMLVVETPERAAGVDAASDDDLDLEPGMVEVSAPTGIDIEPENFEDDPKIEADPVRDAAFAEQTLSNQTVINLDQADPIAEADFHMAYGLYDQAADLVARALETDPDNRELRLKLLEVYFVWGNKEQFLEQAQTLHADVGANGGADWDKVVIMGKQICPDETLFSGSMSAAPEVDLELTSGESDSAGLDFTLEDGDDEVDFGLATIDDAAIELEKEPDEFDVGESDVEDDNIVEIDLDTSAGDDSELETELESELDEIGLAPRAPARSSAPAEDGDDDFMLDIGERTQAGLEAAFLDLGEDDDPAESGAHMETAFDIGTDVEAEADDDDDAAAAESDRAPTTKAREIDSAMHAETDFELDDASSMTLSKPADENTVVAREMDHGDSGTIESRTIEAPTVEAPEIEHDEVEELRAVASAAGSSRASDTVEHVRPTPSSHEMTAELDLDDLGIDVSDIRELPQDLGESASVEPADLTIEQPGVDAEEDDLLSATGVTEVLRDDMDLDQTGTVALDNDEPFDDDSLGIRTEVLEQAGVAFEADASDGNDDNLDLNLDDFSSALEGGATAEQPGLSGYGVDLDVGDDIPGDDEPTGTEDIGPLDPQTMTEVGTKLDLARAYIDMGDPEGAKSILEEVMTEGDSGQRSEAQALMNALPA